MTIYNGAHTWSGRADGSSSNIPQYYGVKRTGTTDFFSQGSTADERLDGIVQEKVTGSEQSITVVYQGPTKAIAGAAFSIGDPLRFDSVGRVVEAKGSCTIDPAGANNSLTFTETDAGRGKVHAVAYRDPGLASVTGYVELVGNTVVAHLSTNSAGTITETADSLKVLLAAHSEIAALVTAADAGVDDGTGTLTAMAATPLTGARNIFARADQAASGAGSEVNIVIERKEV